MYIVQASLEPAKCKIGRTENLQRRLKENVLTGKSKDNHVYNQKRIGSSIKNIWPSKTVFCNWDDPVDNDEKRTSVFALYFLL